MTLIMKLTDGRALGYSIRNFVMDEKKRKFTFRYVSSDKSWYEIEKDFEEILTIHVDGMMIFNHGSLI